MASVSDAYFTGYAFADHPGVKHACGHMVVVMMRAHMPMMMAMPKMSHDGSSLSDMLRCYTTWAMTKLPPITIRIVVLVNSIAIIVIGVVIVVTSVNVVVIAIIT